MAAGDTFRAAASDQLEIWAERTGCEIVVAEGEKAKASSGRWKIPMIFFFFFISSFVRLQKSIGHDITTNIWS